MTPQPNPHSREQLTLDDILDTFLAQLYEDSCDENRVVRAVVKKDNFTKLEKSLRAYTAQQSLLRAKEELESITSPHKYEVWLKVDGEVVSYAGRLTQLDKEIKASRLDAEGGEKKQ